MLGGSSETTGHTKITKKRETLRKMFKARLMMVTKYFSKDVQTARVEATTSSPSIAGKNGEAVEKKADNKVYEAKMEHPKTQQIKEAGKNTEFAHTIFEPVNEARPAAMSDKPAVLLWKEGCEPEQMKEARKDTEMQKTIFESIKDARPAEVKEKAIQLRWKDGFDPNGKTSTDKTDKTEMGQAKTARFVECCEINEKDIENIECCDMCEVVKRKDFQVACRLVMQVRACNILETALSIEKNMEIRNFFQGGLEAPSMQVVDLLQEAMEICYDALTIHQQKYELYMDAEMRSFLIDKENAISRMLDAILIIPEFVPLMWGGKKVGMQMCDDNVSQMAKLQLVNHDKPKNGEALSPWNRLVKVAMDDEKNKGNEPKLRKRSSGIKVTPKEVTSVYIGMKNDSEKKKLVTQFVQSKTIYKPKESEVKKKEDFPPEADSKGPVKKDAEKVEKVHEKAKHDSKKKKKDDSKKNKKDDSKKNKKVDVGDKLDATKKEDGSKRGKKHKHGNDKAAKEEKKDKAPA